MQVVKKENLVVTVRKYTDQQGKEKSVFKTIGELTTFQDNNGQTFQKAELYHIPGASISVFEQKDNF